MTEITKDKVYLIGNWKMNPVSLDEAGAIFEEIENGIYEAENRTAEVVICLPSVFLSDFDSEGRIKLGAQNIFWEDKGAFTGEISAKMVKNMGASFVIIGHSERRRYLGETDEMVNRKVKSALQNGLMPILCIGETLEERKRGDIGEVIVGQLEKALEGIGGGEVLGKLLIAYEPVWAIGSGSVPSSDEIMSVDLLIKKVLSKIYGSRTVADSTMILYGGSVDQKNAFNIVSKTGMNGLLIGGASLNAREFLGIIKSFEK
jgi:triosephosphate isomerase